MKSIRLLAAGFFAVTILLPLTDVVAQSVEPSELLNNLDISPLEYYLDKADRQNLEQDWLRYARFGLSSAVASWENEIRLITGTDFDLTLLKEDAEKRLNDIIEERLTLWLSEKFFRQLSPTSLGELSGEIEKMNELFLYDEDPDGNPVFRTTENYADVVGTDTFGNTVLIAEGDKTKWTRGVKAALESLLARWSENVVTAHAQLLASVSDPELREVLDLAYRKDFDAYRSSYSRKLHQLYYREQSRFIQLRLYDRSSLQYKSSMETADSVSNDLVARTQAELNNKLDSIVKGLNTCLDEVENGGGIINPDDWQQSFQNLLEQGLSRWDDAEEQLLMERIEWEQASGVELSDGEEAWSEAFTELRTKRSEWMSSYRDTLEKGNQLWAQESLAIETVITNAVEELDQSIENSRASLQNRIDNLMGMLLQSVDMMWTSRSSWEYWMDQYDGGDMGSFNGGGTEFNLWAMRRKMLEAGLGSFTSYTGKAEVLYAIDWLEENYPGETTDLWDENLSAQDKESIFTSCSTYSGLTGSARSSAQTAFYSALDDIFAAARRIEAGSWDGNAGMGEAFYWTELFGLYQNYAAESQEQLGAAYGIVVFDNPSVKSAFNGDKLGGALLDDTYLTTDDGWESLYLDSWQVEMLKARAYMQYWQKQQEIAQAVYDYASDESSTKDSAEMTKLKLETAKSDYDKILDEYNNLLIILEDIGTELTEKRLGMETVQADIEDCQSRLERARDEYQTMITDLYTDDPQYLAEQYRSFYLQLLSVYGMDPESAESGLGTAFEEYLLAAEKYGLEEKISFVSEQVVILLAGKDDGGLGASIFNPETAGLSELHSRMLRTASAGFCSGEAGPASELYSISDGNNINDFREYLQQHLFLQMDEYHFDRMLKLFDDYHASIDESLKSVILWEMQRIVRDIGNRCSLDYELRLAELRLNICSDLKSWAGRYFSDLVFEEEQSPGEIYREIIGLKRIESFDDLIPAIDEDLFVYDEIISLYEEYENSGKSVDFKIYDWEHDAPKTPEDLNKLQAYQLIWDYSGSYLEIKRRAEALDILKTFLVGIGDLALHSRELEDAMLFGGFLDEFRAEQNLSAEEGESYNFLKQFLSGGHSFESAAGDLYSYINDEKLQARSFEQSLIDILEENRSSSPALAGIDYEESYASLLEFLSGEGLLEPDNLTFRSPDDIWTDQNFVSAEDVAIWFCSLDTVTEAMSLPSFISEQLGNYLGELKDYVSIMAAQSWGGTIPLDLTILNEEIRIKAEIQAGTGRLLETLQGGKDDMYKLLAVIDSDSATAELKTAAEERFHETAGYDLAYRASLDEGFDYSDDSWSALLTDYLSDTGLAGEDGIEDYTAQMLLRAKDIFGLVEAMRDPTAMDWDSAPSHWIRRYQGSLWNSLDFRATLISFGSAVPPVQIHELERLRALDAILTAAEDSGMEFIGEETTADLRAQYDEEMATQAVNLSCLSTFPESEIYRKLLVFGLGAVLIDSAGWDSANAASLVNWFAAEKGLSLTLNAAELDEFTEIDEQQRLWALLGSGEAEHQLTKDIISGKLERDDLEELLGSISVLTEQQKGDLRELLEDHYFIRSYNSMMYGSIAEHAGSIYSGQSKRLLKQRGIYERFRDSSFAQWDHEVFTLSTGLKQRSSSELIADMAANATRGYSTSTDSMQTPLSINEVFLFMAFEDISRGLWEDISRELSLLQAGRDLSLRARTAVEAAEYSDPRCWRSFLTSSYLASSEDEKNLIPSVMQGINSEDYTRDLTIGDEDDEDSLQKFSTLTLFSGCGDDDGNFILDASNSFMDSAAFLTAALEGWTVHEPLLKAGKLKELSDFLEGDPEGDFTGEGEGSLWTYLDSLKYGEIEDSFSYEADAAAVSGFSDSRSNFKTLLSRIDAVKETLGNLGYRRERLIRLSGSPEDIKAQALLPLKDKITALEADVAAARDRWRLLIDGDGGYRQLESEYSDIYEQARTAIAEIEAARHEYLSARAVYEYAGAGYLSLDGQDLETEDQWLLDVISNVSPARRLGYVNEKLNRGEAAFDALSSIIDNNIDDYAIYEKDEVYRAHFNAYLSSFKESLALSRINYVLNEAVAKQEIVTQKALSDFNTVTRESYGQIYIRDGNGDFKLPEGLSGLQLERTADGWNIGWGTGSISEEDAASYFEISPDSKTGNSCFDDDLSRWLGSVSAAEKSGSLDDKLRTWGLARKWEEYQELDSPSGQEEFFEKYLNRNGETDLDRDGAKQLLLTRWKTASDSLAGSSGEAKWMFNFYKLLERSGSMQIETSAGGSISAETLSFLADEESLVMASEYMADDFKKGAEALIVSSIPVLAMGTFYFALGSAALGAVPFGWIAAIALFAMANFLLSQASTLLGNGTTRLAAARNIQTEIIDKSSGNIRCFLSDFRGSTGGILDAKADYDAELQKLNAMKGERDSVVNLSDAQRLQRLKTSVFNAFEDKELRTLLSQAGVLDEGDGALAESLALDRLFGTYQDRMSEAVKDQCSSSSDLISLLGEEAEDKKEITARELSDYLTDSGGAANRQAAAEEEYRNAWVQYIREEIDIDEFEQVAAGAWEDPLFSIREHLLRLYERQEQIAVNIMGSDQFSTDISFSLLENQKTLLAGNGSVDGIYGYRQEAYRDLRLNEMQILRLENDEHRKHWENQMAAITARGQLEWTAGERKLNSRYEIWVDDSRREYLKQKENWDDKYADFLSDKKLWLDAVSIQSTDYGDMAVLESFGEMTEGAIEAAGADILIGSFSTSNFNPDEVLEEIIDFELLGTLLENARSLTAGISYLETVIFTSEPPDKFTSADNLQAIRDFQSLKNEEFEKHVALIEFNKLLEQVDYAEENFIRQIESANENVSGSLHQTMRNDGYVKKGSHYERQLVVGCSLMDYLYDKGRVSEYNDYLPADIDFSSGLKEAEAGLDNMDAEALDVLVEQAMDDIEVETRRIFGDDDDMSTYLLETMGLSGSTGSDGAFVFERNEITVEDDAAGPLEAFLDWLFPGDIEDNADEDDQRRFVDVSPGFFGAHVGFAPGFAAGADLSIEWNAEGQLKYPGAGEMGRIMGEFIFNKMRESSGWDEVNSPHYKKRLWDDPNALSTEALGGIVTTVITAGAGGALNLWQTAAVNLADDLIFTTADVSEGEMTWDEGLVSFGKKAAGAAFSALSGDIFGSLASDASLLDQVLHNAASQTYSNITGSMVNSVGYDSETGFDFNAAIFDEGVFGTGAIASYAGGAVKIGAGNLLSGSMDAETAALYGSLNNIGAAAAGKGAEYAVYAGYQFAEDGFNDVGGSLGTALDAMDLSVNVLDLGSMVGLGRLLAASSTDDYNDQFLSGMNQLSDNLTGTGIFALNFGPDGISGQITTGGLNLGCSLFQLAEGFTADMAIQAYNKKNGNGALLRRGWAFGDQSMKDTVYRLLGGKDSLLFGDTGGEARTVKKGGGRDIYLDDGYRDAGAADLSKAVAVLQHEAHRDGLSYAGNNSETYRAVKAHTEIAAALGKTYGFDFMAGDKNLLGDVGAYMAALQTGNMSLFEAYAAGAYNSSADYWKLTEHSDGRLEVASDGRGGVFYTDETGEEHEIGHYKGGSRTAHLAKILSSYKGELSGAQLNSMLIETGRAETYDYATGEFLDIDGDPVSFTLLDDYAQRMGAALDYQKMFVESWRNDGDMSVMADQLQLMRTASQYGGYKTDREKYLADMASKAEDFSRRFEEGTATEHLFSQTELENAVGFGHNALCCATVPVNMYQLRDPSISLDMAGKALIDSNERLIVRDDGNVLNMNNYMLFLGQEFNSSQYLGIGEDFYNYSDFQASGYTMADLAAYGYGEDEEHHRLHRNNYDLIDPYWGQLSWQNVDYYRYRGLIWRNWE